MIVQTFAVILQGYGNSREREKAGCEKRLYPKYADDTDYMDLHR
jgi:hypothetical protein